MKIRSTKILGGTAHKLPADMAKAITEDEKVQTLWQSITPLARNEWICWTISCKKPETRIKHIKVMKDKMHKGERRPCCWIGCVHRSDKPMSSSQKWIINKTSKAPN